MRRGYPRARRVPRPGSLTPNERSAYRAARKGLAVVKVRNAICYQCIVRALGRGVITRDNAHTHDHMTRMASNPRFSADTARMRRAELTLALALLDSLDPGGKE